MDLFSTFCFACVGASIARRTQLNFIGVTLSAFFASTGGGTVREILLGSDTFFWVENPGYLLAVLLAIPLAVILARVPRMFRSVHELINSLATSVFIMVGVLAAFAAGCNMLVIVLMGILTGIGGGIIRQVFFDRPSIVQNKMSIVASVTIALFCAGLVIAEINVFVSVVFLALIHFVLNTQQGRNSQTRCHGRRSMRLA